MSETKIKPCPFCGYEAAVGNVKYGERTVREQGWPQATFYYVNCVRCGASNQGLRGFNLTAEAIDRWNERVSG